MRETRDQMAHDSNKLLHEKKSDIAEYEKSVEDYERVINNPKIEEPELQDFLSKNPIVIDLRITKIIPKNR